MKLRHVNILADAIRARQKFFDADTSIDEALEQACELLLDQYEIDQDPRTLCNAVWMYDMATQRGCEHLDTGGDSDRLADAISIIIRG